MTSSLPLTFRHAIDLTRRLGYRYLWIDALCIIQHDVIDWGREAAKMADVYFNSDLSIAASDSKDSRGGSHRRRNPLATTPCMIPAAGNSSTPDCVYAVNPIHRHTQVPLDETHLSTRAWTIQERLLAPRVVHLTHGEVYWECGSRMLLRDISLTATCSSPARGQEMASHSRGPGIWPRCLGGFLGHLE